MDSCAGLSPSVYNDDYPHWVGCQDGARAPLEWLGRRWDRERIQGNRRSTACCRGDVACLQHTVTYAARTLGHT